ncbi:MAG: hypothetical protein IBX55_00075 [Methyloprofundus sp.]|nr:hypothetical protein [Methyloprofundus sp.]
MSLEKKEVKDEALSSEEVKIADEVILSSKDLSDAIIELEKSQENDNIPGPAKLAAAVIVSSWEDLRKGSRINADSAIKFFLDKEYTAWANLFTSTTGIEFDKTLFPTKAAFIYRKRKFRKRKSDPVIDDVKAQPKLMPLFKKFKTARGGLGI